MEVLPGKLLAIPAHDPASAITYVVGVRYLDAESLHGAEAAMPIAIRPHKIVVGAGNLMMPSIITRTERARAEVSTVRHPAIGAKGNVGFWVRSMSILTHRVAFVRLAFVAQPATTFTISPLSSSGHA
jgi:hypothetical protein